MSFAPGGKHSGRGRRSARNTKVAQPQTLVHRAGQQRIDRRIPNYDYGREVNPQRLELRHRAHHVDESGRRPPVRRFARITRVLGRIVVHSTRRYDEAQRLQIHERLQTAIQFVGFDNTTRPLMTAHDMQESLADPPTGVSFVPGATGKVFSASPDTVAFALQQRRLPVHLLRKGRAQKWLARGWNLA